MVRYIHSVNMRVSRVKNYFQLVNVSSQSEGIFLFIILGSVRMIHIFLVKVFVLHNTDKSTGVLWNRAKASMIYVETPQMDERDCVPKTSYCKVESSGELMNCEPLWHESSVLKGRKPHSSGNIYILTLLLLN